MREIDQGQVKRFLEIITNRGQVTFQTFDDSGEKRPELSKIIHGWNQKNLDRLVKLNNQGAGVFLMVNEGDGEGRSTRNVVNVRALFVDLDGAPLDPVLAAGLVPHVTIESSPGRFHAYWLVKDCSLDQFSMMQKEIAEKFNGDKSVHDLPRVMRVAGFFHRKGEAFQTRLLNINSELPSYSVENFKKIITIKPPEAKPDTATKRIREGRSVKGSLHNDLKNYIVGRRKAGLDIEEIRTLVEKWVQNCCPDAKTHNGLIEWAEQHIEPEARTGDFSDLVRIRCVPVAWRLKISGQEVEISTTRELDSYPALRRLVMEQLGIVLPIRSPKAWFNEIENLMLTLVDEEMPDDVSPLGMAWGAILNFCTCRIQARARDEIILGKPWRDEEKGRIYFRSADIHLFLQQKQMKLEPRQLGQLLKKHGGADTTLHVKGMQINVWWIPVEEVEQYRQKENFDPVIDGDVF